MLWIVHFSTSASVSEDGYISDALCTTRHKQLFCSTPGSKYPLERIEAFIEDNKALTQRLYGEFSLVPSFSGTVRRRRAVEKLESSVRLQKQVPDARLGPTYFNVTWLTKRNITLESNRVNACDSDTEVVSPYWAYNVGGKVRAIVNIKHIQQFVSVEHCKTNSSKHCSGDCGCEQKYRGHRLLAYDPKDDCKGIFMDWFLFPKYCVCRCNP